MMWHGIDECQWCREGDEGAAPSDNPGLRNKLHESNSAEKPNKPQL